MSAPFAENFYAEEKTPRKKRRNPNGLRLVRLGFGMFRRDFHALKDSAFLFSAYWPWTEQIIYDVNEDYLYCLELLQESHIMCRKALTRTVAHSVIIMYRSTVRQTKNVMSLTWKKWSAELVSYSSIWHLFYRIESFIWLKGSKKSACADPLNNEWNKVLNSTLFPSL